MQELNMNPATTTAPFTPAGGSNVAPKLGTPTGFSSGALPPKPGISNEMPPMAPQLQAQNTQMMGRGQDSQLVHMTSDEVNSLRGLAQRFGGDLTTNPQTGLPEAGWLGKLLPTILGIAGAAVGIPTWAIAAGGALGGTAATGSLSKGLMIGLQAYGGAGLGQAAGLGGSLSQNAFGLTGGAAQPAAGLGAAATPGATPEAVQQLGQASIPSTPPDISKLVTPQGMTAPAPYAPAGAPVPQAVQQLGSASIPQTAPDIAAATTPPDMNAPKGFLGKYSADIQGALPKGTPQMIKGAMPIATGMATLSAVDAALTPKQKEEKAKEDEYGGPYNAAPRKSIFDDAYANRDKTTGTPGATPDWTSPFMQPAQGVAPAISRPQLDTREKQYFDVVNPIPNVVKRDTGATTAASAADAKKKKGSGGFLDSIWNSFAKGGIVSLETGGHVIPAFDVATLGNGSTAAGQRRLAKMGGIPINGHGDGTSDSIRATIDGKHPAKVADGEVYFPPRAVAKMGGNAKLYSLMRGAEQARMKTKSGDPVKLRRGLA